MTLMLSSLATVFDVAPVYAAPTRLYFAESLDTTGVTPNFGSWTETDSAVRRDLRTIDNINDALNLGTRHGWAVGATTQLDRQFISGPMDSGISFNAATVKLQLACREFNNGDNSVPRMAIYIYSQDGTTLRQTLLSINNYGTTAEYVNNASLRNVQFANGDTVSGTYTTVAGDRLVVEIGHATAAGSTPEAQCRFGAPDGTSDHGENDTDTTALVPWVEFSNTITFAVPNYTLDAMNVYESQSTTLASGTAICTTVDLESASSCGRTIEVGHIYRIEIIVRNDGSGSGSPNIIEMNSAVGSSDVLGNISAGAYGFIASGCSTNTDWTESIQASTDLRGTAGTACSIAGSGSATYWMIVLVKASAASGTSTFTVDDGSRSDVSTTTTFNVNNIVRNGFGVF